MALTTESAEAAHGTSIDMHSLTVIVVTDPRDRELTSTIEAIQESVGSVGAQVIVSCEEPLEYVPDGVEVVVFPSAGKGDRCDAASRIATGDLLAFVDSRVTFSPQWAREALRAFEDPTVMIAAGPVTPVGKRRRERVSATIVTHGLGRVPSAHNSASNRSRSVREVGSSNLVVRTSAFRAVGGFQAPAAGSSEAVRLCYKVRTLLHGKIVSEPGLRLSAPAPSFPGPLLRETAIYGRSRGDLARRLPEAAPLIPYGLPSLFSLLLCINAGIFLLVGRGVARIPLAVILTSLVGCFCVQSAHALTGSGAFADRVLASLALPVVLFVFGLTFLRGYLGRSLEDISPPRERRPPLRVLIMNWRDVTHPQSGGAETYMHEIARRWAAEGIEVAWLTQRHSGSKRRETIDRIHIHRVGGRLTLYLRVAITYLTQFRSHVDIIVDCENGIPFFSPFYSRVPTVLVVHHVHQEIFRKQVPRQLRWLALWLEGSLMPRVYRRTQVVAVSEGTRGDLVDLGFDPTRISIVTNGVVPPQPTQAPPSAQATILCMGRLKPQKSVDVLIRSMPAIIKQVPDLQVDVVGQGPDRRRLERLAWSTGMAQHIRFHGYVKAKVRDEIAAAAWVSVCPSAFEGWGVVCMEASARGLPVVASNVAGLRESVRDGETGVLVPYGDETALADALVSLLQDPDRRLAMGVAGQEWAARHTWDESGLLFASLLSSLVVPAAVALNRRTAFAFSSWR